MSSALFAAFATVNAVMLAMRTGVGSRVDVAMLDCLIALGYAPTAAYLATGAVSSRMGSEASIRVPYNAYETADDRFVFVVANDQIWPRLCRALSLEAMITDPRFDGNQRRVEHRTEVNDALAERIRKLAMSDVTRLLTEYSVPNSPVLTLAEILDSEYVSAHKMVRNIDAPLRGGREPVRVVGMPYKIVPGPDEVRLGPPALGEANAYVMRDILELTD
jgi:CoA:oxalate CoA-transferase